MQENSFTHDFSSFSQQCFLYELQKKNDKQLSPYKFNIEIQKYGVFAVNN